MRKDLDEQRVLELNRRFHDQVEADGYDQRMGVRHTSADVANTVQELERVLGSELPRGGTVVDLGAGTGNLSVKLALTGHFERVIAVDISQGMLAQARAAAVEHGCQVEVCVSDMKPLPLADGSVDLVVGCAVLHHVPDVQALMGEVKRVLRPGAACIFIGEPSLWGSRLTQVAKLPAITVASALRALGKRDELRWDHDDIDVHTFTPTDVEALTSGQGLAGLRFRPEGLLEPVVDQGVLAPVQWLLGGVPTVGALCRLTRRALRALDRQIAPVVPGGLRASVKFAASRAA